MNYIKFLIIAVINMFIFKPSFAIWNGHPIFDLNDYSFMVSIQTQYLKSETWTHWCGGNLINPRFILTAGHCVADENGKPIAVNTMKIATRHGKNVSIKNIFLKPDFYWQPVADFGFPYNIPENDLALIELTNPITDETIIKLPNPADAERYYAPSKDIIALGYGWFDMQCNILKPDQHCEVSYPLLRSANLSILSDNEMKWKDFSGIKASTANPYFYPTSFMGTFSDTQAPTSHDSGSALLFKDIDNNYIIIGTFTTSINYPQLFQPNIYTRIATNGNILWINNIISKW